MGKTSTTEKWTISWMSCDPPCSCMADKKIHYTVKDALIPKWLGAWISALSPATSWLCSKERPGTLFKLWILFLNHSPLWLGSRKNPTMLSEDSREVCLPHFCPRSNTVSVPLEPLQREMKWVTSISSRWRGRGANLRLPMFLLIEASQPLFKIEHLQPYYRVGEECVTCLGSQNWQYCNVNSVSTVVPCFKCRLHYNVLSPF